MGCALGVSSTGLGNSTTSYANKQNVHMQTNIAGMKVKSALIGKITSRKRRLACLLAFEKKILKHQGAHSRHPHSTHRHLTDQHVNTITRTPHTAHAKNMRTQNLQPIDKKGVERRRGVVHANPGRGVHPIASDSPRSPDTDCSRVFLFCLTGTGA